MGISDYKKDFFVNLSSLENIENRDNVKHPHYLELTISYDKGEYGDKRGYYMWACPVNYVKYDSKKNCDVIALPYDPESNMQSIIDFGLTAEWRNHKYLLNEVTRQSKGAEAQAISLANQNIESVLNDAWAKNGYAGSIISVDAFKELNENSKDDVERE